MLCAEDLCAYADRDGLAEAEHVSVESVSIFNFKIAGQFFLHTYTQKKKERGIIRDKCSLEKKKKSRNETNRSRRNKTDRTYTAKDEETKRFFDAFVIHIERFKRECVSM